MKTDLKAKFFEALSEKDVDLDKVRNFLKTNPELTKQTDVFQILPLYHAAASGRQDLCELMLDYGAKITGGMSSPIFGAIRSGAKNVVELLLDRGANVNESTYDLRTPLIYAAGRCNKEICELLLERGADILATYNVNKTVLDAAKENFTADQEAKRATVEFLEQKRKEKLSDLGIGKEEDGEKRAAEKILIDPTPAAKKFTLLPLSFGKSSDGKGKN